MNIKLAFTLAEVLYPKKLYSCAFTLAEVLIVLGIIGLVADMTIPTLHQNITEKVTVTRLKKTYSTFENAFRLAVAEYGTPDSWGIKQEIENMEDAVTAFEHLKPYLNVVKVCDENGGCFPETYKFLKGGTYSLRYMETYRKSFQLADGTIILLQAGSKDCVWNKGTSKYLKSVCGNFGVDINGFQKPNTFGKDFFYFYITKYGIIPAGTADDTSAVFGTTCLGETALGDGCTAWVIYNENMDYLHCDDLSWQDKKSCN